MLGNTEDLEQLAETCLATARAIKEHLAANGKPQMSFDENGPPKFPDDVPPNIQFARLTLREAAQKLADLAAGPEDLLGFTTYQICNDLCAIRYIIRYSIAQSVPVNGSISYQELAKKCKVDPGRLKQVLRHAMVQHIFREPSPGHVGHTAASRHFAIDGGVNSWMRMSSWECMGLSLRHNDALEKWGHGCQEPDTTAFQLFYNTDESMWKYYEKHDDVRTWFSDLMTHASGMTAMQKEFVALGYDWAALGDATIVDVAGNVGHASIPIARANPRAKIIVQDLPQIIESTQQAKKSVIPAELRDRFAFMAHDFFSPTQPVRGADVYFLRMIMHDFSDKYCIKILRPIVEAMAPSSRIIIMDQVLPPVGGVPQPIERFIRAADLHMGVLSNAKERDGGEWTWLIGEVDQRLMVKSVTLPPGSAMSLIEVVFRDVDDESEDEVNGDDKMKDDAVTVEEVPVGA